MKTLLKNRFLIVLIIFSIVGVIAVGAYIFFATGQETSTSFDGQRALEDVRFQTELGPRIPGSQAHREAVAWMVSELEKEGWGAQVQETMMMDHPIINVVARRFPEAQGEYPWVILGAHYDSRFLADQDADPSAHSEPVPGANDGASGVAVLMELARALPQDLPKEVWLVFFDAEDNGNIPGWDWILGSRAFVEDLQGEPDAVVIVDMIGDADLNIYMERNSDADLTAQIWTKAAELGYTGTFIPVPRYSIVDDHTPFLRAGIPAVDIIDFDYPYWHTTEDTFDKVSAQSLQIVGDVLAAWLTEKR